MAEKNRNKQRPNSYIKDMPYFPVSGLDDLHKSQCRHQKWFNYVPNIWDQVLVPTCRNVGQLDSADSLYSGGNFFELSWEILGSTRVTIITIIINYYHLHPNNYDDEYDCPVTRYRGVQVLQSLSISINYYQSLSSYSPW